MLRIIKEKICSVTFPLKGFEKAARPYLGDQESLLPSRRATVYPEEMVFRERILFIGK